MSMRRVSAEWLYCEPFWYELERRGLRVSVFDVPMTFSSRLQRGIELINWGSHDQLGSFSSNNCELQKEIQKRFGSHPMGAEIPVDKTRAQLEQIRSRLVKGAKLKGEISRWLLETQAWDFYLTVLGECHRGGHILWPDEDPKDSLVPHHALLDVYQSVDRSLGEILKGLSLCETKVVIFSLHGMESNSSQEHFVSDDYGSCEQTVGVVRMRREPRRLKLRSNIALCGGFERMFRFVSNMPLRRQFPLAFEIGL